VDWLVARALTRIGGDRGTGRWWQFATEGSSQMGWVASGFCFCGWQSGVLCCEKGGTMCAELWGFTGIECMLARRGEIW
jgi:hypothetical protein